MYLKTLILAGVTALLVAGCGTRPEDRAVSGGLLGAGAGAAIGSVTGDAGKGAIIGGVAGAAAGLLTDPCTLNLGDPYWRRHGEEEYYRRCGHR
ncbi:MAG: YMGG-like glycine zipper-containing protein [Alphaproteobacteria bacterium]